MRGWVTCQSFYSMQWNRREQAALAFGRWSQGSHFSHHPQGWRFWHSLVNIKLQFLFLWNGHLSDLGTEADNISNPLSIVPGLWEELGVPWEKRFLSPLSPQTWSEAAECISSLSSQVVVAHRQKDKRPRVLLSGNYAADTVCVSPRACVLAAVFRVKVLVVVEPWETLTVYSNGLSHWEQEAVTWTSHLLCHTMPPSWRVLVQDVTMYPPTSVPVLVVKMDLKTIYLMRFWHNMMFLSFLFSKT